MGKMITLLMWGYQDCFRIELQLQAQKVLEAIGCTLQPKAFLVGVRTVGKTDGCPVCVEPEDEDWDPRDFFECADRTDAIFKAHPMQNVLYGDSPSMADKAETIRKASVRQAVEEATSAIDSKCQKRSFCGDPGIVEGYHVVPILQFGASDFGRYPALPQRITWGQFNPSSLGLLESTIQRTLKEATDSLIHKDPGRSLDLLRTDPTTILRHAATDFCGAIGLATRDCYLGQDIFELLNSISSVRYEGGCAKGSIAFLPQDTSAIDLHIQLARPVTLRDHKLARKFIELSGEERCCLHSGSRGIIGLVEETPVRDKSFLVRFTGHYKWDLYFQGVHMMTCAFGVPHLPATRLEKSKFSDYARRIFTGVNAESLNRLWTIIDAAMEQRHGTMIVISDAAASEAGRLANQSLGVRPTMIDQDSVRSLSRIDGAILVDRHGTCYAIGVILDGVATQDGDMSRGARYNSAVRYVAYKKPATPTLCVVVSEDGYVDMIPQLRPQIRRTEIRQRIAALASQNAENYHKTRTWLDEHRFYLTKDECDTVNAELRRIDSSPLVGTEMRIVTQPFVPDPAMDETYYLPE